VWCKEEGRRGDLGSIQKVGGCAESDRMEVLGCQRIMWAVHTASPPITPNLDRSKEVLVRKSLVWDEGTSALLSQFPSSTGKAWRFRTPF
jgi:hypothetical protein